MSSATIDRYLRGAKARDQIKGKSTTKPSPLLRSSIKIRKATDEVEDSPGFFEGDTVAHCGPTLKGEFARTLNLTDMRTGWVFTRTVRNNAHAHILSALKAGIDEIPYEVTGLDFDNGTEFLNKAVIKWAAQQEIFFTRSRPYKKNDQATIESKNNHLVRRYGFYYRYDTDAERAVLNRLWRLVNDRLNYLTPTIKPIGYGSTRNGQRRRLYDAPQTPIDRLLAAGVLSPAQETELLAYRDSLNPAAIAHQIIDLQASLLNLAKDKTEQLYLAAIPTALPDVKAGIRIKNKTAHLEFVHQIGVQSCDMETKSGRWNLRVTAAQDAVVRRILDATGESLNDYVVRHAIQAAETDLADRRVFALDDAAWTELQALLDRPASPKPELARLLADPSILER